MAKCICVDIMAADSARHFKECPMRVVSLKGMQEICAWLLVAKNGDEGLVTLQMPNGQALTLMGTRAQVLEFKEQIQEVANGSKCRISLVRFGSREVLQVVDPKLVSL